MIFMIIIQLIYCSFCTDLVVQSLSEDYSVLGCDVYSQVDCYWHPKGRLCFSPPEEISNDLPHHAACIPASFIIVIAMGISNLIITKFLLSICNAIFPDWGTSRCISQYVLFQLLSIYLSIIYLCVMIQSSWMNFEEMILVTIEVYFSTNWVV
jgi:hypothetical protein